MRQYVIVGSGVAGISAAEAIRERDPKGEIRVLADEPHGFYSRPGLAYYLSGEIPERFLFPFNKEDLDKINAQFRQARAKRIDPSAHRMLLDDGVFLSYDRLLIAAGASALPAPVPGAGLRGVVKLDTLEDALHIQKLARKAHNAVVVGGGITALEIVEGLASQGVHTHYFMRGERYWSNVLSEGESRIVEERLKQGGVELHYKTELAEICGVKERVSGVRTQDGRNIACQIVGVAIGVRPRTELAAASGLKIERGILVDEYLRTSHPDIFAAGDAAQLYDPATGKYFQESLWTPARQQGRAAGLNMSGEPAPFHKELALNVTRLAGLTTTILGQVGGGRDADLAGIARGDSEAWRQLPNAANAVEDTDGRHVRIRVGERCILGALVMGEQEYTRLLQQLITEQVDVRPIRESLLQPGAPLGSLIEAFWKDWRAGDGAR